MSIFSTLYKKTIAWSSHPKAQRYLALVSFAESSFFPIPPDVMLIPMGLAQPSKAWRFALITTVFSLLGGALGYAIGYFGIDAIYDYLVHLNYANQYQKAVGWFQTYGIWVVFLAGFSPIPYKLFTIAAGALKMAFIPFMLASLVGRGLRFYLVASVLYFWGDKLHGKLQRYIDYIGWCVVVLFVILFIWLNGWL